MGIRIGSIVTHCYKFTAMVEFWREALGYRFRDPPSDDWAVLTDPTGSGPNLSFQKRDHPRDRRGWIHLDLYAENQAAEVERLLSMGAKPYPWRYPPQGGLRGPPGPRREPLLRGTNGGLA